MDSKKKNENVQYFGSPRGTHYFINKVKINYEASPNQIGIIFKKATTTLCDNLVGNVIKNARSSGS